MLALRIIDIKDFMNKLLIGEVFDHFPLLNHLLQLSILSLSTANFSTISLIQIQNLLFWKNPPNILCGMM